MIRSDSLTGGVSGYRYKSTPIQMLAQNNEREKLKKYTHELFGNNIFLA